ncbi:MAG: hypothetical protein OHK0039_44770 [Bacteroidia bacterium]
MPEVLDVLLGQRDDLRKKFDALTLGKQRNVIHTILKIKNIDKQVQTAIMLIEAGGMRRLER